MKRWQGQALSRHVHSVKSNRKKCIEYHWNHQDKWKEIIWCFLCVRRCSCCCCCWSCLIKCVDGFGVRWWWIGCTTRKNTRIISRTKTASYVGICSCGKISIITNWIIEHTIAYIKATCYLRKEDFQNVRWLQQQSYLYCCWSIRTVDKMTIFGYSDDR